MLLNNTIYKYNYLVAFAADFTLLFNIIKVKSDNTPNIENPINRGKTESVTKFPI